MQMICSAQRCCTDLLILREIRTCMLCSFFFSSRRRHTRCSRDWSSDVCSSDLSLRPPERYFHRSRRLRMSFLRNITSGFRSLFRKEQVDRELNEELGTYLEMEATEIGRASCRERV